MTMYLHHKERIAIFLVGDLVAMLIAFALALETGHRNPMTVNMFLLYRWGIFTLILSNIVVLFILDVYSLHRIPGRFLQQSLQVGVGLLASAALTTLFFFFFRNPVPRAVFILFFIFSWMLMSAFRTIHSLITLRTIYWKVLLVGSHDPCAEVAALMGKRPYLHSQIIGYLSDDPPQLPGKDVSYLGSTAKLRELAIRENVDQIIVASDSANEGLIGDLMECMKRTIKVTDFRAVIETISGEVPIDHLSDTWFIRDLATVDKRYFWAVKRLFDVCFSAVVLTASLPFLTGIVALIRLDSRGPAFYSQQRIGRGGIPFRLWKLRTMVKDADNNNVHWTNDNDVRITRCGRILRKLHVDELPQLYNVLRGDMSLIGPRPEAISLVERYKREIPYYMERHMVTPGLTGWAQINFPYGNSVEDAREKLKYDFYYIKNRSIVIDVGIFLRTIRTVLTGKGAL